MRFQELMLEVPTQPTSTTPLSTFSFCKGFHTRESRSCSQDTGVPPTSSPKARIYSSSTSQIVFC